MNKTITITGGPGQGEFGTIAQNDNNTLTVHQPWINVPDGNSTYTITGRRTVAVVMSTDGGQTFRSLAFPDIWGGFTAVDQPSVATGPGGGLISTSTGANTATTLNDTPQTWAVNEWAGKQVKIIAGLGVGQTRTIQSNGANQLVVTQQWATTPDNTSQYQIQLSPGSVWVSWRDSNNFVSVAGAPVYGTNNVGSFTTIQAPNSSGCNLGEFKVGPNGQVLVIYMDAAIPANIRVAFDPDGLGPAGWRGPNTTVTASTTNVGRALGAFPASPFRGISAEPNLAWDRSGLIQAGNLGRVYLVYLDSPAVGNVDTNVYVRYSNNGGATWSARQLVHSANAMSQFMPAVAVDQTTGFVAFSWYDCRNDNPANTRTQLFASATDGTTGAGGVLNVTAAIQVAPGFSNAAAAGTANPGNHQFDYGDYRGMDYAGGLFVPAWADNSNSTGNNPNMANNSMDVYIAPVLVTVT